MGSILTPFLVHLQSKRRDVHSQRRDLIDELQEQLSSVLKRVECLELKIETQNEKIIELERDRAGLVERLKAAMDKIERLKQENKDLKDIIKHLKGEV